MSVELIGILTAIVAVGVTLAGVILTSSRGLVRGLQGLPGKADLAKNFLLQDTVRVFQALKTVFLCPATPTSSVMRL